MCFHAVRAPDDGGANSGAKGAKVYLRQYVAHLKKSAEGTGPYAELVEMGPSLNLHVRRVHRPSPELMKAAMVQPKAAANAPRREKNISHSALDGRQGRLHMPKQNLREMATARMKGLKRPVEKPPKGKDAKEEAAPAGKKPAKQRKTEEG
tara:strand:+ start:466 stop:918 length:453 start_codon:yes stop_codon:yes gene_type:complete